VSIRDCDNAYFSSPNCVHGIGESCLNLFG